MASAIAKRPVRIVGISLTAVLGIVLAAVELQWRMAAEEMAKNETRHITMVCRVLEECIRANRGMPKSWEEFVRFQPAEVTWPQGVWPSDAFHVEQLIEIQFESDICDYPADLTAKTIIKATDQRGWSSRTQRELSIDGEIGRISKVVSEVCATRGAQE